MDCDPRWEREHMVLRLAEIVDLNNGEKALMACLLYTSDAADE